MNKQTLKRILSYTKPYIAYLIIALISAIISISATLYAPVVIGKAIDKMIGQANVSFNSIFYYIKILLVTVLIAAVFQWLMNFCTNIITQKTVKDIRDNVFKKLQYVPLNYIDKNSHGDIINRVVNDIDQISNGLLQGFTQLFSGIVTILGTIIFMLSINVPIALVVIFITPLSLFVASFISKRSYNTFKQQAAVKGELSGYIEEMLSGQKVIKAFSYEKHSQEKFEEINDRLKKHGVKAQFYSSLTNPCTRFVNAIVYASVTIVGAISVIKFGLSIGMLSTFLSYANQYTKPFNEISGVITELQSAFASARRVFSVLDEPIEPPDNKNDKVMKNCDGNVKIDDVYFSYNKDVSLIEDFNLNAKAGQRIAIVGPTGCGKTTIINLLMRFYDIDSGKIKVDNIDIKNITRNSLRSNYGMVLQETWLFVGTIRDNIAYGKPNATDKEIIAAAKLAHAHGFIKRLSHGYDTVITQDGDNISQGQKQLLCIARIMLTMPPMLILDEATSSIDTRTEIKIQKAFQTMMKGRTSFIVAHRLSTIKEADCILFMDSGKIMEQGTHEELLLKNGYYAHLYKSQFKKTE